MVLTVIVLVLVMELLSLILHHGIREEATLCRYRFRLFALCSCLIEATEK
jgi:hypothetical protein